MEVSFLDLKEREIINVYDGKKIGKIVDVVFNIDNGVVRGIVAPGDKKVFRKADDIFIPLDRIKRIGDDVILIGVQREMARRERQNKIVDKNIRIYDNYIDRGIISDSQPKRQYDSKQNRIFSRELKQKSKPNQNVSYVRLRPIRKEKYN